MEDGPNRNCSINRRWNHEVEIDSVLISNGHCPGRKYEDTFQIFSTIEGNLAYDMALIIITLRISRI